mgnify:CR=1 FL=1
MNTQVLIIGAGPTGLMLSNQLSRYGIKNIIIDTKTGPTVESRALSVSSRSMEIYQQLGLSDTVLKRSKEVQGITMVHNGKKYAQVDLTEIGGEFCDFARLTTTFEQNKNEQLLLENLSESFSTVLWNHAFDSFKQENDNVFTQVKNIKDNTILTIKSKYLVGCDGASSAVRKTSGFSFDGGTYDNKFYVADVSLSWEFGYDNVVMMPEKGVFVAFFPLQENKKMRIIGTLPKEFAHVQNIEFSTLESKVREVAKIDFMIEELNWFSVYRIHHRVVDSFNKGKVFLAGDAAHVHSPAGGQGMNTGLQDAHNLGWKLGYVLNGFANESLLATYNEERLPYAKSLVNGTDKGFQFISGNSWLVRNVRSHFVLPLFSFAMRYKLPAVGLFKRLSQLYYSYKNSSLSLGSSSQSLKFGPGDQIPYVRKEFYKNFQSQNFHLVCITAKELTLKQIDAVRSSLPFPIDVLQEQITPEWQKFGVQLDLFVLIRPDHHILWIGDTIPGADNIAQFDHFKILKT